jgi:hypothetical protein
MRRLVVIIVVGFLTPVAKAAPFINLDFELGSTNSSLVEVRWDGTVFQLLTFGTGPVSDLLPGWGVFIGGQQTNLMAVGSGYFQWLDENSMPTYAALVGRGADFNAAGPIPIDGDYALSLDNHRRPLNETAQVLVSQRGEVPTDAKFLTLKSYDFVSHFGVLIEDNRFDYLDFRRDPKDPATRSLDISQWAGKTITLGIYLPEDVPAVVDSIAFVPALDWILTITRSPPANGEPPQVTLGFAVAADRDYFVEFRDNLGPEASWQSLPGAPHNSGTVIDSATIPQRFYRLRSVERSQQTDRNPETAE